ncbi:MAG TPA: hypothetical protein VJU87_08900 [Gemmatimonadaceae bacterium]|nr:hypothetical protein [Gemmatimonadaceae bacterium]
MRQRAARSARRAVAFAAAALAVACLPAQQGLFGPAALRDWPAVLANAQASAGARRFDAADATLADFAMRYPGTAEAQETNYWRALFRIDPLNPSASLPGAMALLNAYLAGDAALPHRSEAEMLRRLDAQADALTRAIATVASGATGVPGATTTTASTGNAGAERAADLKSRDAEIQRLKDELAKANDELDRIKRRLATPTKPPG